MKKSYVWAKRRAEGRPTRLHKLIGELAQKTSSDSENGRRTEASAVVSPDFDTQRLARILIEYARRESRKGEDDERAA